MALCCWKCRDFRSYPVARYEEWMTGKGPQGGYLIVHKQCECARCGIVKVASGSTRKRQAQDPARRHGTLGF